MNRIARRWVWVLVLAISPAVLAQTIRSTPGDEKPTQETLKRLAQQLGAGGMPSNIDPELMKAAMEYLKKNPQVLDDPNFKQQMKQWQEQAKSNPQGLEQQFKKENPDITPEQLEALKKQFQQSNSGGGGFKPPPSLPPVGPQTTPTPPTGQGNPTPTPSFGPPPGKPGTAVAKPIQPPMNPGAGGDPTGQGQSSPQNPQSKEGYQQAVGMWEKGFGSIDDTPEMKKTLIDMFSGDGQGPWDGKGGGLNGLGGTKPGSNKPWWDTSSSNGQQSGFISWMKNTGSNPPSWWKDMGKWNNNGPPPNMGGGGSLNPPQYSGGGSGGGFGGGGGDFGSAALPVILFVGVLVALAVAFVAWRYWPQIKAMANKPKPIPGLGPWTIDPRDVTDRETLVKAFEYLSVLICGDGARMWNHLTIADAFRENVPGAAPFAEPLARLYALARYSPANEPIRAEDIAEARGYLCRLAEVQA